MTRHWLELANQWLEVTRQFLWLHSVSKKIVDDSDSTKMTPTHHCKCNTQRKWNRRHHYVFPRKLVDNWLWWRWCILSADTRSILQTPGFFSSVSGTRFGSLELNIESLETEKIIIGSLESEKIGSLQVHTRFLTFALKITANMHFLYKAGWIKRAEQISTALEADRHDSRLEMAQASTFATLPMRS